MNNKEFEQLLKKTWTVRFDPSGGYDGMSSAHHVEAEGFLIVAVDAIDYQDIHPDLQAHDEHPIAGMIANFIAAAPEMHEVLERIATDTKAQCAHQSWARTALAKARGEEAPCP